MGFGCKAMYLGGVICSRRGNWSKREEVVVWHSTYCVILIQLLLLLVAVAILKYGAVSQARRPNMTAREMCLRQ